MEVADQQDPEFYLEYSVLPTDTLRIAIPAQVPYMRVNSPCILGAPKLPRAIMTASNHPVRSPLWNTNFTNLLHSVQTSAACWAHGCVFICVYTYIYVPRTPSNRDWDFRILKWELPYLRMVYLQELNPILQPICRYKEVVMDSMHMTTKIKFIRKIINWTLPNQNMNDAEKSDGSIKPALIRQYTNVNRIVSNKE